MPLRILAAALLLCSVAGAAQARIAPNAQSANALVTNALTQNALTSNSMTMNGTAATSSAVRELNGVAIEAVDLPRAD